MNDIGLDFKVIGAQLSISKQLFLVDISFQQCPACSLCSPCCFVANCLDINHAESFPLHYQLKNLAHPKLKLVVQFPWKYSFKKGLVFVEEYLCSVEKNVLKPPFEFINLFVFAQLFSPYFNKCSIMFSMWFYNGNSIYRKQTSYDVCLFYDLVLVFSVLYVTFIEVLTNSYNHRQSATEICRNENQCKKFQN